MNKDHALDVRILLFIHSFLLVFNDQLWLKILIRNITNVFPGNYYLFLNNCCLFWAPSTDIEQSLFVFSFMSRVWVSALLEAKILHEVEWGYLSRRFSPAEQRRQTVDSKRVSTTRNTTLSRSNENDRVQGFVDRWCVTCKSISRDWAEYIKKYSSRANRLIVQRLYRAPEKSGNKTKDA